jgi:hypothetical protein
MDMHELIPISLSFTTHSSSKQQRQHHLHSSSFLVSSFFIYSHSASRFHLFDLLAAHLLPYTTAETLFSCMQFAAFKHAPSLCPRVRECTEREDIKRASERETREITLEHRAFPT